MIRIDLTWAISGLVTLAVLIVFIRWAFYNFNGRETPVEKEDVVEQCPYCTYVFQSDRRQTILRCPRCESLLKAPGSPEPSNNGESV